MTYATDDAERSSACEMLYACRGKIASDIQQEASRGNPSPGLVGCRQPESAAAIAADREHLGW
ncbi:MAG: hypothetical protein WBW32_17505 [Luteibacter sp.]